MNYLFDSTLDLVESNEGIFSIGSISAEPSFYGCSPDFISTRNAPLHHYILKNLLGNNFYKFLSKRNDLRVVIDSRVTHTMYGMYPSIPGWHCDSVPRDPSNNQPRLNAIDPNVQHFLCLLSSCTNHSETEFLTGKIGIDIDEDRVWDSLNKKIESNEYFCQKEERMKCKPGNIYRFDQKSIHRASPTIHNGWRLFFRLSFDKRQIVNQIRKQVQVYTEIGGW